MKLLQRKRELKSVRFGHVYQDYNGTHHANCYNITSRDIANILGCLRDNTSLRELTIRTVTDQSEVRLTAKYYFPLLIKGISSLLITKFRFI